MTNNMTFYNRPFKITDHVNKDIRKTVTNISKETLPTDNYLTDYNKFLLAITQWFTNNI